MEISEYEKLRDVIETEKESTDEMYRRQFLQKYAEVLHKSEGSVLSQMKKELDEYYKDHSYLMGLFNSLSTGMRQLMNVMYEDKKRMDGFYGRMRDSFNKIIADGGGTAKETRDILEEISKEVTPERQQELIEKYEAETNHIRKLTMRNHKMAASLGLTELECRFLKDYARRKKEQLKESKKVAQG